MNNFWLAIALFCLRRMSFRSATNRMLFEQRYKTMQRMHDCR